MEAMSIESLLLAVWEEKGFVGRTRVPVGRSDIDALAVQANTGTVGIGESKVTGGSQAVQIFDPWNAAEMTSGEKGITWWLEGWSNWLDNLQDIWRPDGQPAITIPWLLPVDKLEKIEVIFCANLQIIAGNEQATGALQSQANDALQSEVKRRLQKDDTELARRLQSSIQVCAKLISTVDLVFKLVELVCRRIDQDYSRRFGDPLRDNIRELHRYMAPDLSRTPWDAERALGKKKDLAAEVRRATVLKLLQSLGVKGEELIA